MAEETFVGVMNKQRRTAMDTECTPLADDLQIIVCDQCLRACCWQGNFMCDRAYSAGTVKKTVAELRELAKNHPHGGEHQDYWHINPNTGVSFVTL